LLNNTPFKEENLAFAGLTFISVKLVQPLNAPEAKLARPLPIVTDIRLVQPLNALQLILVTPLPIVTDLRLSQPLNTP
jgi:hypothetical protein